MIEVELKPCINRCVRKGTEHDDQPQLLGAKHGRWCDRCYWRAWKSLDEIPGLLEHIVSHRNAAGHADGERVDTSDEAPVPGNTQALEDADGLYALAVNTAADWAAVTNARAPRPTTGAHRRPDGTVLGLPVGIAPTRAREAVTVQVKWLQDRLEDIFDRATIGQIEDLDAQLKTVWQANARWPRIPRAYFSQLPCPDDGGRIAVYPPHSDGDPTVYRCETCNRDFSDPAKRAFYARVFAEVSLRHGEHVATRQIRTSRRVERHLANLYGTAETTVLPADKSGQ